MKSRMLTVTLAPMIHRVDTFENQNPRTFVGSPNLKKEFTFKKKTLILEGLPEVKKGSATLATKI